MFIADSLVDIFWVNAMIIQLFCLSIQQKPVWDLEFVMRRRSLVNFRKILEKNLTNLFSITCTFQRPLGVCLRLFSGSHFWFRFDFVPRSSSHNKRPFPFSWSVVWLLGLLYLLDLAHSGFTQNKHRLFVFLPAFNFYLIRIEFLLHSCCPMSIQPNCKCLSQLARFIKNTQTR